MPKKKTGTQIGLDLTTAVRSLTGKTPVKKGIKPESGPLVGRATIKLWNAILRGDSSWRNTLDRDHRNGRYDRRDG